MNGKKIENHTWFVIVSVMVLFLLLPVKAIYAAIPDDRVDVCSQATSIPPFLSSGYDPNLLLMMITPVPCWIWDISMRVLHALMIVMTQQLHMPDILRRIPGMSGSQEFIHGMMEVKL